MSDTGDVHRADLNEERRRQVLVVSNRRFNELAGRVLVAPELLSEPDEVPFPWRVQVGDAVFAVDLLRSLPIDRLLEKTDRASASTIRAVQRVLANIT